MKESILIAKGAKDRYICIIYLYIHSVFLLSFYSIIDLLHFYFSFTKNLKIYYLLDEKKVIR